MAEETGTFPLIRTKMRLYRIPGDLIPQKWPLERLRAARNRMLMLISAQAVTHKTTILAQWLADAECPQSSAYGVPTETPLAGLPSAWTAPDRPGRWLPLDGHDNGLNVSVSFLTGADRTLFAGACEQTSDSLNVFQASLHRAG